MDSDISLLTAEMCDKPWEH